MIMLSLYRDYVILVINVYILAIPHLAPISGVPDVAVRLLKINTRRRGTASGAPLITKPDEDETEA